MIDDVIVLRGGNTALVFACQNAVPSLVYWGVDSTALDETEQWNYALSSAAPRARMNHEVGVSLAPDASQGSLLSPLLSAHKQGKHFAQQFKLVDIDKQTDTKADRCTFSLVDTHAELTLKLMVEWHSEQQCFALSSELINDGDESWSIDKFNCPSLPLDEAWTDVLTLSGRWGGEFRQERCNLTHNALLIEHREGRTGPQHHPSCVVGSAGFGSDHGHLMGVHLGWSGNYQLRIERHADGSGALQAGAWFYPGEMTLDPKQNITTPWLYAVRSEQGLNRMSQYFHRYMRDKILPAWTRTERPIQVNSWEAVYFDHRHETLTDLVDAAARVGAERFVLDDGWFLGRRDDTSALGDWTVCPDVYPEGLHPLVNHVLAKGLLFGLWVEPEMVSPNSELARHHPDWVLQLSPYDNPQARQQWVLDLSNHDAYNYIESSLKALLDEYPISYLKWDMNRPLVLPGDSQGKAVAQAQVTAVYKLMDALCQHQPNLEIESCSSGGGRIDAGVLRYTGRVWASDNNDPVERLSIQNGMGLFFPPEIMGAHVGPHEAHLTLRETSLSYRMLLALQGQFGLEVDLRHISDEQKQQVLAAVDIYRTLRRFMAEATVWRYAVAEVDYCAYIAKDKQYAWVWALTAGSMAASKTPNMKVKGLDPTSNYTVKVLMPSDSTIWLAVANGYPAWMDAKTPISLSAVVLEQCGIPLPVLPPQSGILLYLERNNNE